MDEKNRTVHFLGFVARFVAQVVGLASAVGWVGCATGLDTHSEHEPARTVDPSGKGGAGGGPSSTPHGGASPSRPCGVDCSQIETDACYVTECNLSTRSCAIVAAAKGTKCEDGLFCTVNDACDEGLCLGGNLNDCGLDTGTCEQTVCDEPSESCALEAMADDTPCTSDDLCTVNAKCFAGECLGSPKDCTYAPTVDDCHVAECNPANGLCEQVVGNEGKPCTDPNALCTVGKSCQAGTCVGGYEQDCSYINMDCWIASCDTNTGDCAVQTAANGDPCDDLDPCTIGESCQGAVCGVGVLNTTCTHYDNCCPSNCHPGNDNDCSLTVLLMGDDVMYQAYWDIYREALQIAGLTWTERDLDTQPFPDANTLAPFNVLIWFDEHGTCATNAQALVVANWLSSGGKNLFLTGMDMLGDLSKAYPGQGKYDLYTMLGTTYLGDFAGLSITSLDCVLGDPLAGDFVAATGLFLSDQWFASGDYAQATNGPAIHAATYAWGGSGSGHSALSHYDAGSYRVVWLGLNFHNGLYWAKQRALLMSNVVNFFKP